ncbi:MAG TPA: type II toxin-antitoxin system VapC family toxin [Xanthobacteraceae bacterium]|nr:type II toxin-antitoxin system VapC family toxin [Xanthobacteraceae bacterium]
MSVYLDASVLVALFANDSLTDRADAYLRARPDVLVVSDFAAAEFASAFARRVRMGLLTADEARRAFSTFDTWTARECETLQITALDIAAAASFLRRLDLVLRTPDAVHIAVAQRLDAELLTYDDKMASGARALGVDVLIE